MTNASGSSARLLLIKFVLIVMQVLLLVVTLLEKQNHLYFEVGQSYSIDSEQYKSAESSLQVIGYTMIALCVFEFICMIIGTSVPPVFAKLNLL